MRFIRIFRPSPKWSQKGASQHPAWLDSPGVWDSGACEGEKPGHALDSSWGFGQVPSSGEASACSCTEGGALQAAAVVRVAVLQLTHDYVWARALRAPRLFRVEGLSSHLGL